MSNAKKPARQSKQHGALQRQRYRRAGRQREGDEDEGPVHGARPGQVARQLQALGADGERKKSDPPGHGRRHGGAGGERAVARAPAGGATGHGPGFQRVLPDQEYRAHRQQYQCARKHQQHARERCSCKERQAACTAGERRSVGPEAVQRDRPFQGDDRAEEARREQRPVQHDAFAAHGHWLEAQACEAAAMPASRLTNPSERAARVRAADAGYLQGASVSMAPARSARLTQVKPAAALFERAIIARTEGAMRRQILERRYGALPAAAAILLLCLGPLTLSAQSTKKDDGPERERKSSSSPEVDRARHEAERREREERREIRRRQDAMREADLENAAQRRRQDAEWAREMETAAPTRPACPQPGLPRARLYGLPRPARAGSLWRSSRDECTAPGHRIVPGHVLGASELPGRNGPRQCLPGRTRLLRRGGRKQRRAARHRRPLPGGQPAGALQHRPARHAPVFSTIRGTIIAGCAQQCATGHAARRSRRATEFGDRLVTAGPPGIVSAPDDARRQGQTQARPRDCRAAARRERCRIRGIAERIAPAREDAGLRGRRHVRAKARRVRPDRPTSAPASGRSCAFWRRMPTSSSSTTTSRRRRRAIWRRRPGVEVLDRTAVILEIFPPSRPLARGEGAGGDRRGCSTWFRVCASRRRRDEDRQRGGIGGKGAGESSLELDRRKIRDRIAELGP